MNAVACKLSCASDEQLLVDLRRALEEERARLVEFLRLLGEVDARRLYVPMGFSSLFGFCVEGLGLSSDQAYRRAATARVGRRFPSVWALLSSGELHMSGIAVLAKHLDDDGEALLDAARGKSKVEIEAMVSALDGEAAPRVTLRISVSPEAEAQWRRAQALAGEEPGVVFERAVSELVARLEKQKFKTTDRPRSTPTEHAAVGARPIAAAVKRAVTNRDGRRCTFVGEGGRRCGETARLEFDHVVPVARGGRSVVGNLRLRCRAHNQLEAERAFGRAFMARKRGTLPGQSDSAGRAAGGLAEIEGESRDVGAVRANGRRGDRVRGTLPGQSDSAGRSAGELAGVEGESRDVGARRACEAVRAVGRSSLRGSRTLPGQSDSAGSGRSAGMPREVEGESRDAARCAGEVRGVGRRDDGKQRTLPGQSDSAGRSSGGYSEVAGESRYVGAVQGSGRCGHRGRGPLPGQRDSAGRAAGGLAEVEADSRDAGAAQAGGRRGDRERCTLPGQSDSAGRAAGGLAGVEGESRDVGARRACEAVRANGRRGDRVRGTLPEQSDSAGRTAGVLPVGKVDSRDVGALRACEPVPTKGPSGVVQGRPSRDAGARHERGVVPGCAPRDMRVRGERGPLPAGGRSGAVASTRDRPREVPSDASLALRALDFTVGEVKRLVDAARPVTEEGAPAEAWVGAALRAYRNGALEGASR